MKTEIIRVNREKPEKAALKKASEVIHNGGLVAFPTETVYGLAADYRNREAVQRLRTVKKRPPHKPFTVHIAKLDSLGKLACQTNVFSDSLIRQFWPGPLTLILRSLAGEKIGVRMPENRIARDFISECEKSIVAPSANISGSKPPRTADEVLKDLDGKIHLVLDGGPAKVGTESTVVDMSVFPYRIVRRGAITESRIADVGRELQEK